MTERQSLSLTPEEIQRACERHWPPAIARGATALGLGVVASAHGATLTLTDGRAVVDLSSGGFGYGHAKIIARVTEQVKRMPLSSRMFYSVPLARLLERIGKVTPGDLAVSFFGNAGAEAVEGALKLVRGYHRDRTRVVAAINGYHGATTAALAVCGVEALRKPVSPSRQPVDVTWVPYGNIEALRRAVDDRTAAVLLEPTQVAGGVVVPPSGYLREVRAHCTKTGALLVVDEVTTGLGITGRTFGVDHEGVAPDVMILAGALGGGLLPIGAYVTTAAINARVYDKRDPLLHANTTGGNPSACTAALAAFDVLEEEELAARAARSGELLAQRLTAFATRHGDLVASSNVHGLLGSLGFHDVDTAKAVQRSAAAHGVLVRVDGIAARAPFVSLRAPLMSTEAEIERGLTALGTALQSTRAPARSMLEAQG